MSRSTPSRKGPGRRQARPRPAGKPAAASSEALHGLEIEINHLRQLFRDTHKAYGVVTESEIAQLVVPIRESLEEGGEMGAKQRKVLHQMVTLIRKLNIRPEKGRRKDLKRIEETVAQLTTLAEKWQWLE